MAMNTRSVQRALNSMMSGRNSHNGELFNREPAMRIGTEYQAEVPDMLPTEGGFSSVKGVGSVLVWSPCHPEHQNDVDLYVSLAKDQYGYSPDQALGLLYWHHYQISKATEDLPNFCPLQDEWSVEDKVTFEQAFQYHGKNFQRIRAMLPDKPINSLVKHYYLRKKSYSQYSLMDKHARKNWKRISTGMPVSNDDTDSNKSGSSRSETFTTTLPIMLTPTTTGGKGKQLPRGIYLSTAELASLANDVNHAHLRQLDSEIQQYRESIQNNKQFLAQSRDQEADSIEQFRPSEYSKKSGVVREIAKWTEEEIQICLDVIAKQGRNYEALVNALNDKTLQQVKNFFTNYKRKLNLPRRIAEFEKSQGQRSSRSSRKPPVVETRPVPEDQDELISNIILGQTSVKRPKIMPGNSALSAAQI